MTSEPADRWADLGEFIRQQRSTARLSLRRLSEIAGISNPYLSQIERGLRKPSAEILQQIARALRISAETLYVRAGILEDERRDDDVVRHILTDPHLVEEQRQALVRIYLSFRRENGSDDRSNGEAPTDVDPSAEGTEHAGARSGADVHPSARSSGPRPPAADTEDPRA
jgi:transcriptional regulator with XRE-family HTH domain